MARAVIDASVIVSWFLPDEIGGKHGAILDGIDAIRIHVPSIFEFEIINILLNAVKRKRIDESTALRILEIVGHYPIVIESSTSMLRENIKVFEMAQKYDLTAYDAAYLELAIRLDMPIITYDKLLLNTAKRLKLRTVL